MIDPKNTGVLEQLPFVSTAKGTGSFCTDLIYTFRHQDGTVGDEVAIYEDGKITFKKTGKVTLTVSSASGSRIEATNTYTFNINEGYNVHTYEELYDLVNPVYGTYTGDLPINFVVLEKPVSLDPNSTYEYGYSIVPAGALKPQSEQTVADIRGQHSRLQFVNISVHINGNNHPVDASQMKIYTEAELRAWIEAEQKNPTALENVPALISVETWAEKLGDPAVSGKDYIVKLYNLHVIGNVSVGYDPTKYNDSNTAPVKDLTAFVGGHNVGISVGAGGNDYDSDFYFEAENLSAEGFRNGFNFYGIVDGKIKDVSVGNCYATGIAMNYSILKLTNVTLGPCGATGIEFVPKDSDKAGVNNNQNQQIIIDGTIDAMSNLNDMKTTYFKYYTVGGAPVQTILNGNIQEYAQVPGLVDHIRNDKGQFIFVALTFNDIVANMYNASQVTYPNYQEGGIIDIMEVGANIMANEGINTTHQFISVPIYVTIPGEPEPKLAGTALFYNHNYGK